MCGKRQSWKQGQVTMYFLAIVSTLIIVTFITVNIGKIAKDKTHSGNAADAGALAACSVMAAGFNYVADKNGTQRGANDVPLEYTHNKNNKPGAPQADQNRSLAADKSNQVKHDTEGWAQGVSPHGTSAPMQGSIQGLMPQEEKKQEQNIDDAKDDADEEQESQLERAKEIADDLYGEQGEQSNFYDNALKAGYLYCFYNSGIQQKVSGTQINSRRYQNFLERLQQQKPSNGTPQTFFWVDGAARAHAVTCLVQVEKPDRWNMETARDTKPQTDQKFEEGGAHNGAAQRANQTAQVFNNLGVPVSGSLIDRTVFAPGAKGASSTANTEVDNAARAHHSAQQGKKKGGKRETRGPNGAENDTIAYINDIHHSQTVFVANFQFHMGGPVKGMRGDVDVPTFYPPVQSTAQATFNHGGQGRIHNQGGEGSSPRYECGLITAW
ncbi:MAG: hypothetical protein GF333_08020 [Candidatus Omnitrophica bacterium]|nr:hypothetical protein [Candidatus Omnitrophota bacterium]